MGKVTQLPHLPAYFKQRRHRRFNLSYPVALKFRRGHFTIEVEATSKNVSVGGLLLQAAAEIPPQTRINFAMTVQGGILTRPLRITGEGKVVRVEPGEQEQEFAIAVQCLSPVTQIRQCLPATG